jgi:prepilin-type N-terminal cleavage/methylation domain-containing protein
VALPKRHLRRSDKGFSLLEILAALAIGAVATAFAAVQVTTLVKTQHENDAVQLVQNQLRTIHQRAIDTRSEYVVTFSAPGTIAIQFLQNGSLLNYGTVNLPGDEQFLLISGVPLPPKTPDGFGSGALAIDFDQAWGGGSNVLFFYPDGTVLDGVGNPNNGVLYIAQTNDLYSSRAITLWGVTGRIKTWKLVNVGGVARWE